MNFKKHLTGNITDFVISYDHEIGARKVVTSNHSLFCHIRFIAKIAQFQGVVVQLDLGLCVGIQLKVLYRALDFLLPIFNRVHNFSGIFLS
jgi:hypothetical protein